MAEHRININENIKVELTDFGFQKWKEYDDSYLPAEFQYPIEHYREKADKKGIVSIQIWVLMQVFGRFLKMGMGEPLFKENDIIINIE